MKEVELRRQVAEAIKDAEAVMAHIYALGEEPSEELYKALDELYAEARRLGATHLL